VQWDWAQNTIKGPSGAVNKQSAVKAMSVMALARRKDYYYYYNCNYWYWFCSQKKSALKEVNLDLRFIL